MHVIKTFCLFLLLYRSLSLALDFNQLDFDESSCIFSFNRSLYILGQTNNIKVSFGDNWSMDLPGISNFTGLDREDMTCTITKSGQLFLLQQSACAIKNMSSSLPWDSSTNVVFRGSQSAIQRFATNHSIQADSVVAFGDNVYLFDRDNTVFVLDTIQLIWREFKSLIPAPLFDSSSSLYSTSRWILLVRTDGQAISIDGFDPYTFHWLGTLWTIHANANTIKAIPIQPSIEGSDSLLLVPIRSSDTQSSTATEADEQFWRLDIPNVDLTQIIVTPIASNRQLIQRGLNSTSRLFAPTFVTLIATDLVMFYQDNSGSSDSRFQFLNTTTLSFVRQPQWLVTNAVANPSSRSKNYLAVILGSVIGGVAFIVILILLSWYCLRRKRRQNQDRSIDQPRRCCTLSQLCFPFLCGSRRQSQHTEPAPSPIHPQAPYLLSPIQPSSPLHIFPPDQTSSSSSLEKPTPIKSKFKEHFDLGSIAEFESNSNLSTRPLESPTTPNEKAASRSQTVQQ
ncbi:hypothetical protein EDC96DRAFT_497506 [Choanephora cucurbitarum]|nr:hypothetical protein EDC96DRAFT_497506 [Choanephora cucurbitarum]